MSRKPLFVGVLAAVVVALAALGAAACGTVDTPPGGGGSDSTTTTVSPPSSDTTSTSAPGSSTTTLPVGSIQHPTGPNDVVIKVLTGGGFVPIEYQYTVLPEVVVYGDGRIVVTGPMTMEYPSKALPNLQTTVVSEEVIQAMLAAAKEAGLFQTGLDYGQPGVADVGTTTITINADGKSYTSSVYALGFEDGGNLTMQQQQARAAVQDVRGKFADPTNWGVAQPVWESFDFTAVRVYSRAVDPALGTASTDIQPNHLPWPLADLATSGKQVENAQGLREVVVSGEELATIKPLLQQATQITLWKSGTVEYNLFMRPLLPDEAAAL
jgi:hypothetical protein